MDWSTVALFMFLLFVCGILTLAWLFYSIVCRIVRAFTRTTQRTVSVFTGTPYRKR